MFRTILIPVDLSDRHGAALEAAAQLAGAQGAEVTLLHVVELLHGSSREEDAAFYDRLEQKARGRLAALLARLRDRGVAARSHILFGSPVSSILRFAQTEGADLIVLSSHTIDPTRPDAGFGTMSYLLGIAARCPVLLVKGEKPGAP
jgi:nucleotide-binding universal stress UspA family protein